MRAMEGVQALGPRECRALAGRLPDTPETVIAIHVLRRGFARAWLARGDETVLIRHDFSPEEPTVFGPAAGAVWPLLKQVHGWHCVNVDADAAEAVRTLLERRLGTLVASYDDVYHVLDAPPVRHRSPYVRRLTRPDAVILRASADEIQFNTFGSLEALLTEGFAAGAVIDGRVVSVAKTTAISGAHVDIGVETLEGWRGCGLATAAASIIAQCVQNSGRVPVWSTVEANGASLRVAQKLGFRASGRRVYLVPDWPEG